MLETTDHLSNEVETSSNADPAAAGVTTVTGATLDMSGFDGARAVVPITDVLDTSVITLKAYRGAASNMSDEEEIEGNATKTSAADDDLNGKLLILDVKRPSLGTKKYLRFKVTRATANAALGNLIVERYLPREVPISQHADVSDLELISEPDAA